LRFAHCHCSRCRKATGTGHATNLYCSPERFTWLTGEQHLSRYDLPGAESFAPSLLPQARIFFDSRASWSCGRDEVARFAELPDCWR